MFEIIFLFSIAGIFLAFASVQDLKTRIVANWICFSMIFFAMGFRLFYFLFYGDQWFFYNGILGFLLFLVLGNLFYYGRVFAGSDAKLMISLGAILPVSTNLTNNFFLVMIFLLVFLLTGAAYRLLSSIWIAGKNLGEYKKELRYEFKRSKKQIIFSIVLGIIILLASFNYNQMIFFALLVFLIPYFYIHAKAVDEFCMIKSINSRELTEGDWLYEK